MNLLSLIFICALEAGATGNQQNDVYPFYYVEAEAGVRIDNVLFLTGSYCFEQLYLVNEASNQHYKINLSVLTDYADFGIIYDYDVDREYGLITIWGRLQTEGWE